MVRYYRFVVAPFRKVCVLLNAAVLFAAVSESAVAAPFIWPKTASGTVATGTQYPQSYRMYSPPDLAADPNRKFPLVLFLHGSGEAGTDNQVQAKANIIGLVTATQSPDFESFLLAPQTAVNWSAGAPWDHVIEILNTVEQKYPQIDTNRIYLTGLSMGGFGTFSYMAAYPNLWAAAVPIAGGGNPTKASLMTGIPTWVFHGTLDDTVPVEDSREMVDAIRAAGGNPLYTEFPDGHHSVWNTVYNDHINGDQFGFYPWLFSQTKAVPEPGTFVMGLLAALGGGLMIRRRKRART